MQPNAVLISLVISVGLAFVGIAGDLCIRAAGSGPRTNVAFLLLGAAIYASTAFGWLYAMRHIKFSTIGVYFGISTLLLLTAVGVFFLDERLNGYEVLGIAFGIASLALLGRFA